MDAFAFKKTFTKALSGRILEKVNEKRQEIAKSLGINQHGQSTDKTKTTS